MTLDLGQAAAEIAARAEPGLEALVAVSSPSGDVDGAEAAIALCVALGPEEALVERVPCSTAGCAPDLVLRVPGRGRSRLLLLGHLDTVIPHREHAPLRPDGERLYGPGTVDMKGGVVLALGVARALSRASERFAELAVLLVVDEEWRMAPFAHVERFAGFDACLCFEAGERSPSGEEAVVLRRKAAGTMRVRAHGRAAHSGSAPDDGASALLALARVAGELAGHHDPRGPERISVVPTVMRAGEALNVVPAEGELVCDMRADRLEAFDGVRAAVPESIGDVRLEVTMDRLWPGMDSRKAATPLLTVASRRLGHRVVATGRGGASDASHLAARIPMTVDGPGPRGGGAHTPEEYVLRRSLAERAEVAIAVAEAALTDDLRNPSP